MENRQQIEKRALVLAPRGRDAQTIEKVLLRNQVDCKLCGNIETLMQELECGAGTALITEEALIGTNITPLVDWLAGEPAWSDFPFILLVSKQPETRRDPALDLLEGLCNVILLERPLNAQTLHRATASALRARKRQYQNRAMLLERTLAEERLRLTLKAGRLGAWEIDLTNWELRASDTCKANFGRTPDAPFSYFDFLSSVHPEDKERHQSMVRDALAAKSDFDIEFRVIWPDESLHWLQARGEIETDGLGKPISIAGVTLEVTDRQKAAQQLRESRSELQHLNDTLESRIEERTRELAQLNDRLMREINERERTQMALVQAQKMEAIGRLTGGIAHDFNNLLHVIVGNVDLIDRLCTDERIKRFAATAKKASQRGTKLTGQLLAFARNQSLDLKAVDLSALIEGLKDLLQVSVGSKIKVTLDLQADMPAARADLNQIEMAILNLAINARDAMPDGGKLTVRSTVREAVNDVLPDGRYAVISVTDTGSGIRPEILAKVFDPFFTTKPVGQGTGLGLSQVYGVAQQCGGNARILSEPGQGTTAEIWLPLALEDVVCSGPDDSREATVDNRNIKVLVVEDDAEVRQFMVESLQILGYQVRQAPDGMTGLRQVAAERPDLLIVDFLMPGMDGAEVVARLTSTAPELPIIVATGYADMRAIDEVIGSNAILRKPFQINDLARSVQVALSNHRVQ